MFAMGTYAGSPALRVRVKAEVEFDAYIFADSSERIANELADAIENHAPHLRNSEAGDALIALTEGGSGQAVKVSGLTLEVLDGPFEEKDVVNAIESTQGWL